MLMSDKKKLKKSAGVVGLISRLEAKNVGVFCDLGSFQRLKLDSSRDTWSRLTRPSATAPGQEREGGKR